LTKLFGEDEVKIDRSSQSSACDSLKWSPWVLQLSVPSLHHWLDVIFDRHQERTQKKCWRIHWGPDLWLVKSERVDILVCLFQTRT
jgi:hypothetical protein